MSELKGYMLPPSRPVSRVQTPQPLPLSQNGDPHGFQDRLDRFSVSSNLSSVASLPDLKKTSTKRPKFVARASQYLIGTYGKAARESDIWENLVPKQEGDSVPLERIVHDLQNAVLADPLRPLGVDRHSLLLRVLEGYMALQRDKSLLEQQLIEVIARHDRNVDMLEEERKYWKQDEDMFRGEIKRLEVMIAEGKVGLSQVTLARQQSMVRSRGVARARRNSARSDAIESVASTASSTSNQQIKIKIIRPTTPSGEMKDLSKNIKSHRSFLNLDFFPERPPSRLKGWSLADVDIPKQWRKQSEATSRSVASSPAKTVASDFSSDGGDLLPDELEQQELDKEAIKHVAKLMSMAAGTGLEDNVQLLNEQIAGTTHTVNHSDPTPRASRSRVQTFMEFESGDGPTVRCSKGSTIAERRGTDALRVETENQAPSAGYATSSGHFRRPFSFYAGDDHSVIDVLRTAPPRFGNTASASSHPSQSSPDMPLRRQNSLIPSPVPEHVLARPRREDSSSSVITSLQRSPIGETRPNNRPRSSIGRGILTRTSSSNILGDRTNDCSASAMPRLGSGSGTGSGSVRRSVTAVRGPASVQSLVQEMEEKGKDAPVEGAIQGEKSKKESVKKDPNNKSPKGGKKEKSKKEK